MNRPGASEQWARAIATSGGLGDILPAPGTTAGSFPAVVLWCGLMAVVSEPVLRLVLTLLLAAIATAVGVWAAAVEARRRGFEDPGPVVIDEVAGQWLTYAIALALVELNGWIDVAIFAAAGFFLFRFFDIVKPWPVCALERLPGGVGIVADDLAAGIYAGGVLMVLCRWFLI